MNRSRSRRRLAVAAGVLGSLALGRVTRPRGDEDLLAAARAPTEGLRVRTESILPGTPHETPWYVLEAPTAGPTATVVGGIHGDERNGIEVAREVAGWSPDAGRLVVLPAANRVAIERDHREGEDGDLNRQFPAGSPPKTELARAILAAIATHPPEVLLDLHRSLGIYGVHPRYVGQAILHSPSAPGGALAARLNEVAVPWYTPAHRITAVSEETGGPMLFHAANRAFGADAYVFETTDFLLDQETRNELTRLVVATTLARYGLLATGSEASR